MWDKAKIIDLLCNTLAEPALVPSTGKNAIPDIFATRLTKLANRQFDEYIGFGLSAKTAQTLTSYLVTLCAACLSDNKDANDFITHTAYLDETAI